MEVSYDSINFAQLLDMNAFLTRKFKEGHAKNMLLETIKTLGVSAPPAHNVTEAEWQAKNRANWLKHYDPNRYCFS